MPTFAEHLALAEEQPAYWSHQTSLEFVDAIVAEMDAQGVSRADLARRMDTSRAWVSRVLAGECNLTLASMGKLAFALGMKVTTGLMPVSAAASAGAAASDALAGAAHVSPGGSRKTA